MNKYLFHCQLKMKHMKSGKQRVKFNAEFFTIPRINERVMFHDVYEYFLENKDEGARLFASTLDMDDHVYALCKVVQVVHFDKTMVENNKASEGIVDGNALGILYLDSLEDDESICPTGAP